MSDTEVVNPTPKPKLDRNAIRSKVLGESHKPKYKIIEFFGADVEIRQPTLGSIIDAQNAEDAKEGVINILLTRTYVPREEGAEPSEELIFDASDEEVLRGLPFGADLIRVSEALTELSGVNFPKPNES